MSKTVRKFTISQLIGYGGTDDRDNHIEYQPNVFDDYTVDMGEDHLESFTELVNNAIDAYNITAILKGEPILENLVFKSYFNGMVGYAFSTCALKDYIDWNAYEEVLSSIKDDVWELTAEYLSIHEEEEV